MKIIKRFVELFRLRSVREQGAEENIWTEGERKWQEAGEDYIMRSFITYTLHQISLR
jgi:hypothetical protein